MVAHVIKSAPKRCIALLLGPKWSVLFLVSVIAACPQVSKSQQDFDWPLLFD